MIDPSPLQHPDAELDDEGFPEAGAAGVDCATAVPTLDNPPLSRAASRSEGAVLPDTGSAAARSAAARAAADDATASHTLADLSTPRRRLVVGWCIFGAALVLFTIFIGVPYSEDEILLWLTAALLVASLGDPATWRRGVLRDWLPLYVALLVYALLRGYASDVLWGPFVAPQVAFDKFIGGGQVPTVTLQRWLFRANDLRPWDYLAWLTYMSHFFTSFIVAGVLWKRDHPRFRRFVALWVSLTFLGYLTYLLYPALPPWLAAQSGHIAPITRIIPVMWNHVGVHGASALFTGGNRFDNNIAAMPSLHAAYPMLLLLFFWKRAHKPLRAVLVTYVLAMAFTLVYTGEHFVLDEFVGWSYAIVTFVVGNRALDAWARWRKGRREAKHAREAPEGAPAPEGARTLVPVPIEATSQRSDRPPVSFADSSVEQSADGSQLGATPLSQLVTRENDHG